MGHQTKLTMIQKIAIFWLKKIDNSLFLFEILQAMSQVFRFLFYIGLIGFTIFGMKFISSFVDFSDAPIAGVWAFLGNFIFYGVIVGAALVLSLESVIKLDVAQIFRDDKAKKTEIKANKLQKWRLKNMNIFIRIVIYISFYIFAIFIIQISAQGAFIDIFATAPNNAETQKQITIFMDEYDSFVKWFTFLYIISGLTLDYFVNKKRGTK